MSFSSSWQRCPRCQSPLASGAVTCPSCGLALGGAVVASQQSAYYASQSGLDSASTIASPPPPPPGDYASLYPGSQPQGDFPYALPPAPSSISGPAAPLVPPTDKRPQSKRRLALVLLVMVLLLFGGGGVTAYLLLTQPKPTITVSSDYKVGTTLAGSAGTVFHISGQDFSSGATILFLLDGQPAPGAQSAQTDGTGAISSTDVTVTTDWALGNHVLTARDSKGYKTQAGVPITIAPQGQAGTPGPSGAPTDSKSFSLSVQGQITNQETGASLGSLQETLIITGQPDPKGGAVCQARDEPNAPPQTIRGNLQTDHGVFAYLETIQYACSGSYQVGKLIYIEQAISDQYTFETGETCSANTPYTAQHLEGTFSDPTDITGGTYTADQINLQCQGPTGQFALQFAAKTGDWTGSLGA
ncbi:MAG TPA: zinc ribbon domain-containing protein [Ktedonobacterales bacterium]|nr:zinc ribbon domain-containing protein [Ktedonobacterales bacterium]